MELKVIRKTFTPLYTMGELYVNGQFFCYTMEDRDRDLSETDSKNKIKSVKVVKQTAIPYGEYRLILSYSKKLRRFLPLVLDVPGFQGIRLHKGSTQEWSSGCILLGMGKEQDKLTRIVEAETKLVALLKTTNETEASYIKIIKQ
jgi:hypothetical protein